MLFDETNLSPNSPDDLTDPKFLADLEQRGQGRPVEPDGQDFDQKVRPFTVAEQAEEYQLAHARKMIRLFREWKRDQN